jgi:hypothetical protein
MDPTRIKAGALLANSARASNGPHDARRGRLARPSRAFLVVLGLLWPRRALGARAATALFWLAIYGTFANWATTLLAAYGGAGTRMPLAAGAHHGTTGQELAIEILLFTLSVAIVAACVLVLWGLRRLSRDR